MNQKNHSADNYKMTDVGLIPSDWDVKELGDCLISNPQYGINAAAVAYSDVLPTYIRITDISEGGKFIPENKTSVNHFLSNNYFLEEGDLVFARTGASVGKTYLYDKADGKLVFAGFLIRVKINPEKLNPIYLKSFTNTKTYWSWVRIMSMRSGQPGINGNEYKQLQIPLPPTLTEQTAIATALSDADALITSLEKLIAKKRNVKQGAMQTLLAPKKNWVVKKLGEIGKCIRGVSYNGERDLHPHDTEITVRLLRSNNVQQGDLELNELQFVDKARVKSIQYLQKNDIVICMANGSKQLVGKSAIFKLENNKYTFGAFMGCFRTDSTEAENKFISYVFQTFRYRSFIDILLSGSSINNLKPSDIESIDFYFPSLSEQQTISQILSDMDAEIEALEIKLNKYKLLKQGMMQNLLTGKIRLV